MIHSELTNVLRDADAQGGDLFEAHWHDGLGHAFRVTENRIACIESWECDWGFAKRHLAAGCVVVVVVHEDGAFLAAMQPEGLAVK